MGMFGGGGSSSGGGGFLSALTGGLFGGGGAGGAAGGAATGGGFLSGIGGLFSSAGSAISSGMSSMMGLIGPLLSNPITAIVAAGIAAFFGIKALIGKSTEEKVADETARDFGIKVAKSTTENFIKGLSASDNTVKGIRKDISSSPAFLREVLLPAAQEQGAGAVNQLIQSFSRLQVSAGVGSAALKANPDLKFVRDAAGNFFFDISDAVRKAVETGSFQEFNQLFKDIFNAGGRLSEMFPGFAKELLVLASAFDNAAQAAGNLNEQADAVAGIVGGSAANIAAQTAAVGDFLPGTGERVQSRNEDGSVTVFGGLSGFREIPSMHDGGMVERTGLAFLHQGERVIPRRTVSGFDAGTFSANGRPGREINVSVEVKPNIVLNASGEMTELKFRNVFEPMLRRMLETNARGFTKKIVDEMRAVRRKENE